MPHERTGAKKSWAQTGCGASLISLMGHLGRTGVAGGSRTARGVAPPPPRPGTFPVVVTVISLLLALGLFFQSTAPALQERQELAQVELQKRAQLQEMMRQTTAFALRRTALEWDLQTILVELDRQGIYPGEILAVARRRARRLANGDSD